MIMLHLLLAWKITGYIRSRVLTRTFAALNGSSSSYAHSDYKRSYLEINVSDLCLHLFHVDGHKCRNCPLYSSSVEDCTVNMYSTAHQSATLTPSIARISACFLTSFMAKSVFCFRQAIIRGVLILGCK